MVSLAYTKKIDGKLLFKMISRQGRLRNNASHSGKRETAGCQSIDRGLSSQRPVNCVYFLFRDRKNIFCELNIMRAWRFNTNVSSVVTLFFLVSTGIIFQFLFLAEMNTVCAEMCTKWQTAGVDATAAVGFTPSRPRVKPLGQWIYHAATDSQW